MLKFDILTWEKPKKKKPNSLYVKKENSHFYIKKMRLNDLINYVI